MGQLFFILAILLSVLIILGSAFEDTIDDFFKQKKKKSKVKILDKKKIKGVTIMQVSVKGKQYELKSDSDSVILTDFNNKSLVLLKEDAELVDALKEILKADCL